ncbi:hypothetical protein Pfo_026238 [Paulownia fortunei]|nr:hypothetical protein Pfo_026238 [Paulownia fortunei]
MIFILSVEDAQGISSRRRGKIVNRALRTKPHFASTFNKRASTQNLLTEQLPKTCSHERGRERGFSAHIACAEHKRGREAEDYVRAYFHQRAGELSAAEIDKLMTVAANPQQFKIPNYFLNRQKDYKDGKYSQVVSNALDMKLRDDLERLKKIRNHRGLRHYWGLRVRGQHTKTTGRRDKTIGVSKKR